MTTLFDVGFEVGVLVETIVSTYCTDNTPHAAAMGCLTIDGQSLIVKPFTNTKTYKNLMTRKSLVVNITHDPVLFYNVVFNEMIDFEHSKHVNAPVLKHVSAWVEANVIGGKVLSHDRTELQCAVKHVESLSTKPRPYSRAEHALIESLIHYTRVKAFANTDKHIEALQLVDRIKYYSRIVERVSTSPSHLKMMRRIVYEACNLVGMK